MIRIFQQHLQDHPFQVGAIITINEKASHHLIHVLRVKMDEEIILFNGNGFEYQALIHNIKKKNVSVIVKGAIQKNVESPINIILGQGIARGDKMDFIVQKAIELGVHTIAPLVTQRSQGHVIGEKRLAHWQDVAISACEQSGRNIVPKIISPQGIAEWIKNCAADKQFILSPSHQSVVSQAIVKQPVQQDMRIALLIGPEGGFSLEEVEFAQQNGFDILNLGPRILRTETAALAAITVMQFCYGDLS